VLFPERKEMNKTDSSLTPPPRPVKHSWLGIASFMLAVLSIVIISADVLVIWYFRKNESMQSFATIDTILTFLTAILALVGLGLGITAVVRKSKRSLFGVLGLALNGLFLLVICIFYTISVIALMRAGGV
jgi:magnesium-transporting ATPase (P-type)